MLRPIGNARSMFALRMLPPAMAALDHLGLQPTGVTVYSLQQCIQPATVTVCRHPCTYSLLLLQPADISVHTACYCYSLPTSVYIQPATVTACQHPCTYSLLLLQPADISVHTACYCYSLPTSVYIQPATVTACRHQCTYSLLLLQPADISVHTACYCYSLTHPQ